VVSRAAAASETLFVGRTSFGLGAGSQVWDTQSWGSALSLSTAAGASAINTSAALTVSFNGLMAAATADTVLLRNFTVIRYPAQTNP
jgi:Flp pilus assembly pilin Flp